MKSLVNLIPSRIVRLFLTSHLLKITKQTNTGSCYNSVNNITFDLAQSDHIKRLLLYIVKLPKRFILSAHTFGPLAPFNKAHIPQALPLTQWFSTFGSWRPAKHIDTQFGDPFIKDIVEKHRIWRPKSK